MLDAGELLRLAELVPGWQGYHLRFEAEIALALEALPQLLGYSSSSRLEIQDERMMYVNVAVVNQHGGRLIHQVKPPAYLHSLDAAMTAVPPEHVVQLSQWDHDTLRAKGPWMAIVMPRETMGMGTRYGFTNRCQHAPTASQALLCAALRAQAYQLIPPPEPQETKQ